MNVYPNKKIIKEQGGSHAEGKSSPPENSGESRRAVFDTLADWRKLEGKRGRRA